MPNTESDQGNVSMHHQGNVIIINRAPIEFTDTGSKSIRRQIEPNRIEDTNSNSGQ